MKNTHTACHLILALVDSGVTTAIIVCLTPEAEGGGKKEEERTRNKRSATNSKYHTVQVGKLITVWSLVRISNEYSRPDWYVARGSLADKTKTKSKFGTAAEVAQVPPAIGVLAMYHFLLGWKTY